jgi:serine/threonine protein kinase
MSPPNKPDFSMTQQFKGLESTGQVQMMPEETEDWASLPLFSGMSQAAMEQFQGAMDEVIYATGETILNQGDSGEDMFVLESGTMRVTVTSDGTKVFERTFVAPQLFGEMALITREPRSASVTAETKCRCMRIDKRTVQDLFRREPGTAVFLTRLVGERLMEASGIRRVGKYEVLGRLGSGGVATVFEGQHPELGTPVALKMLSHALVFDEGFADHFAEEARRTASLAHDNIVAVMDTEQAYGTHFIVMEKLTGDLLQEAIYSSQRMGWKTIRRILIEALDALAYAHTEGFVHRDIKPENIFLRTDGKVKIMDFGIATQSGGQDSDRIIGTPYYISPEQVLSRQLDGRADLYSLGITAYEMCCQRIPFDADTVEALFRAHIQTRIPDPRVLCPDIPDDLRAFILRACKKSAKKRFPTCAEARDFLKAAAEVPVLDVFAMSSLSVTYHTSRRSTVEEIMSRAVAELKSLSGVAFFEAHRAAGPSAAFVQPLPSSSAAALPPPDPGEQSN